LIRVCRVRFSPSPPAFQRPGFGLWLVVASLILQSCAPGSRDDSASVADKFFRQVAHEISPALYARLDPPPIARGRNNSVALVFLEGGVRPPTATCGADLKAGLEKQLTMLAARTHIGLRLTTNVDEAAVVVAIGDTFQEPRIKNSSLDALMSARQGGDDATSTYDWNFGVPGYSSPDFLEGVFANSNNRLIFGVLSINWMVTSRGVETEQCSFDFIARLARLYSLALNDNFRSEYSHAWRAARMRTGLSAYEVPNTGLEEHLGLYFCAQFASAAELAECSAQALKLMTNTSR